MANDNKLFEVTKRFREIRTVGGEIQYVLDNSFKGSAIPVRTVLEIVCRLVLNGECAFFELKHGPLNKPIKLIIDKSQYDAIKTLMDA